MKIITRKPIVILHKRTGEVITTITNCEASYIDFKNANFNGLDLHDCEFNYCEFDNVDFEDCNIENAKFNFCNFINSMIDTKDLFPFDFQYCRLPKHCKFYKLKGN